MLNSHYMCAALHHCAFTNWAILIIHIAVFCKRCATHDCPLIVRISYSIIQLFAFFNFSASPNGHHNHNSRGKTACSSKKAALLLQFREKVVKTKPKRMSQVFIIVSHFPSQPSSDVYLKILAGDEVIQVNDQIVVSMAVQLRICIVFTFLFSNLHFA